jgi:hypothetical protein
MDPQLTSTAPASPARYAIVPLPSGNHWQQTDSVSHRQRHVVECWSPKPGWRLRRELIQDVDHGVHGHLFGSDQGRLFIIQSTLEGHLMHGLLLQPPQIKYDLSFVTSQLPFGSQFLPALSHHSLPIPSALHPFLLQRVFQCPKSATALCRCSRGGISSASLANLQLRSTCQQSS